MCGRLACSLCPEDVQKACAFKDQNEQRQEPKWVDKTGYTYKPFYNGPPTTSIPVLIPKAQFSEAEQADSPDYCIGAMKWGFSPAYTVDSRSLLHTHNARIETVRQSRMYKPSLTSGRCVVVAEGFYEWQTTKGASNKQPYFIYQNPYESEIEGDKNCAKPKYLMKMAGLFTCCEIENVNKYSCTVFTTESDSSLSWLHHRMPVILNTQNEVDDWLNYKGISYETALESICKKFQERTDKQFELKYYTVDKKYVNKSTCNEAKCMEKISLKRPSTLDSWLTLKRKK